jgi:[acyl-carrier-protein] S-malonyltransferase
MAGHSLGEYSALVASGAMGLEDGLRLLDRRARLMGEAGRTAPGTMAAILGLDSDVVREICAEADADICNLNLPSQIVVGGTRAAVERAMELAKEKGAQRAVELNVSGAFHSRLMQPAANALAMEVQATRMEAPRVPVVANASATPMTSAMAVREELCRQVATTVLWHDSVTLMAAAGVSTFIERLVPGATLLNLSGAQPA